MFDLIPWLKPSWVRGFWYSPCLHIILAVCWVSGLMTSSWFSSCWWAPGYMKICGTPTLLWNVCSLTIYQRKRESNESKPKKVSLICCSTCCSGICFFLSGPANKQTICKTKYSFSITSTWVLKDSPHHLLSPTDPPWSSEDLPFVNKLPSFYLGLAFHFTTVGLKLTVKNDTGNNFCLDNKLF